MAFKRSLAWTMSSQAVYFLVQFGGSVVLAHLLTPYELGVYTLAVAIVGILNIIQSVGLGAYLVREADLTPAKIASAFTVNAAISTLLAAAIALMALASLLTGGQAGVGQVLLILAISPLINIFGIIPWSMLERDADFRTQSIVNVVRNVLGTAITVYLAWLGFSYFSIAWGQLIAAAVGAVMLNVVARRHASVRMSLAHWREIGRFGVQMVAISGIATLASRLSDVLMGRLLGITVLGLFSRASGLFNQFWENLHNVFGRIVFAELARRKREAEPLRDIYLSICDTVAALLWPGFAGLIVLAEPLIRTMYGAKWLAAAHPFQLLALAGIVQITMPMTWEIFVVSNATALQARLEVLRTIAGTILFGLACTISLEAAAAARVVEAVVQVTLFRPHIQRMTQTHVIDLLPIYARAGLLSLLAVAPALALTHVRASSGYAFGIGDMAAAIAAGAILWSIGLIAMRHAIWQHVRPMIGARRRGSSAS